MPAPSPFTSSQQSRLEQFQCSRSVDIHCHVLPGIDDGPRNPSEAIRLCRALVQDGFTDVIATPHQLGRWDGTNHADDIRTGVIELRSRLESAEVPLRIHAGGEVRLDERIPKLIGSGHVLTLADRGIHLLLELPLGLQVGPSVLVPYLTASGTRVVLAHAERYDSLVDDPRLAEDWVQHGVAFQVNAVSLTESDRQAQAAWEWLSLGWVALVATDAHGAGSRRPKMSRAIGLIIERAGIETARRVCIENPVRVLEGRELV